MKRILVFVICCCLFMTGCSRGPNPYDVGEQILYCFDNDDVEGLKSVFCQAILSHEYIDLDEQIEEAFEFYEGKAVDYNINYAETKKVRNGKVVKHHKDPIIVIWETDCGKEYYISATMITISEYNQNVIGVSEITIYTCDDNGDVDKSIDIGSAIY